MFKGFAHNIFYSPVNVVDTDTVIVDHTKPEFTIYNNFFRTIGNIRVDLKKQSKYSPDSLAIFSYNNNFPNMMPDGLIQGFSINGGNIQNLMPDQILYNFHVQNASINVTRSIANFNYRRQNYLDKLRNDLNSILNLPNIENYLYNLDPDNRQILNDFLDKLNNNNLDFDLLASQKLLDFDKLFQILASNTAVDYANLYKPLALFALNHFLTKSIAETFQLRYTYRFERKFKIYDDIKRVTIEYFKPIDIWFDLVHNFIIDYRNQNIDNTNLHRNQNLLVNNIINLVNNLLGSNKSKNTVINNLDQIMLELYQRVLRANIKIRNKGELLNLEPHLDYRPFNLATMLTPCFKKMMDFINQVNVGFYRLPSINIQNAYTSVRIMGIVNVYCVENSNNNNFWTPESITNRINANYSPPNIPYSLFNNVDIAGPFKKTLKAQDNLNFLNVPWNFFLIFSLAKGYLPLHFDMLTTVDLHPEYYQIQRLDNIKTTHANINNFVAQHDKQLLTKEIKPIQRDNESKIKQHMSRIYNEDIIQVGDSMIAKKTRRPMQTYVDRNGNRFTQLAPDNYNNSVEKHLKAMVILEKIEAPNLDYRNLMTVNDISAHADYVWKTTYDLITMNEVLNSRLDVVVFPIKYFCAKAHGTYAVTTGFLI